jgi:hypothetical protein
MRPHPGRLRKKTGMKAGAEGRTSGFQLSCFVSCACYNNYAQNRRSARSLSNIPRSHPAERLLVQYAVVTYHATQLGAPSICRSTLFLTSLSDSTLFVKKFPASNRVG